MKNNNIELDNLLTLIVKSYFDYKDELKKNK